MRSPSSAACCRTRWTGCARRTRPPGRVGCRGPQAVSNMEAFHLATELDQANIHELRNIGRGIVAADKIRAARPARPDRFRCPAPGPDPPAASRRSTARCTCP
jgi:hypothetical protein